MSHFAGLVVLTPDYLKNHSFADSLAKYDEGLEVPEYSRGEVSDFDKVRFIEYYSEKKIKKNLKEMLYNNLLAAGKIEAYNEEKDGTLARFYTLVSLDYKDEYAELFKKHYPKLFDNFSSLYAEKGNDWNDNRWRINHITGNWEEYSTYNPLSKFDWYDCSGRWSKCVKTKNGEYVNECLLGEIDWSDFKPEDYEEEEKEDWLGKKYKPLKENVKYHFTKSAPPFCLVVDGEWFEKGQMLYWGMTSEEKEQEEWNKQFFDILDRLPEDSLCYNVDFHI